MLWTTPESLYEQQPLSNEDGTLLITADARIDNRGDLQEELKTNGPELRTTTDTELILRAYEVWGEACSEKLLGDFAFAIWDSRRRRLFCARDPIGIKPFFYLINDHSFRWASEPEAILVDPVLRREPNPKVISFYLLGKFHEREETLYRGILRLEPGHYLLLEDGKLRIRQYWDIDPKYAVRYKNSSEYGEHFLAIFRDAVRVRLRSHRPIGALLSGGLDSSAVVCTAHLLYGEAVADLPPLELFSIIFNEFPCDERRYIEEVARRYNLNINYLCYDDHPAWMNFDRMIQFPYVIPMANLFMIVPALEAARHRGVHVVLDGLGCDELFYAGPAYLTDLLYEGRIGKLICRLWQDATFFSQSRSSLFLDHCVKPMVSKRIKRCFDHGFNHLVNYPYGSTLPTFKRQTPIIRPVWLCHAINCPPWLSSGFVRAFFMAPILLLH
jgi:asparagine synthase (glutamine-hydrolysing)